MGALCIWVGTDGAEALESGQNALWGSQDGNGISGKARGVRGFELALEDEGGEGELFFGFLRNKSAPLRRDRSSLDWRLISLCP